MWKQVKSNEELAIALQIREQVFVEEQGVSIDVERDQYEAEADHVLVFYQQKPVGTGRLRVVVGDAKLERVCILSDYRNYGFGKEIIHALEEIAWQKGLRKVKLHGQTQAAGFYRKLGYQTNSEIFMEDGIPHVLMTKELI